MKRDLLYVAVPGRRNYLQYGGIGVLASMPGRHFQFVKRIPTWTIRKPGTGKHQRMSANATTGMLIEHELSPRRHGFQTDKMVWEQTFDGDCCDRAAVYLMEDHRRSRRWSRAMRGGCR